MDERVEWALRKAALWDEVKDKLSQSGSSLSGGQQQRLCIARGIAIKPEVLLLDEPCSALDPISTAKIEELIAELKNDYTVVIVTHNMQQAARVLRLHRLHVPGRADRSSARPTDLHQARSARRPRTTSPAASAEQGNAMTDKHLSTQFDSELNGISSRVMELGGLVESQIRQAIYALAQFNADAPGHVIETEDRVNEMEVEIDRDLSSDHRAAPADGARPAPADRHLQDHRQPRARRRRSQQDRAHGQRRSSTTAASAAALPSSDLRVAAELAIGLLRKALDAFARLDTAAAVAILKEDDLIDQRVRRLRAQADHLHDGRPAHHLASLDLLFVAKAIERIGDHAKNIAEFIIYIVKGADVRHSSMDEHRVRHE